MIGVDRRIAAIQRGRSEPLGTPDADLWGNDIVSAAAEYAVSQVTNRRWNLDTGVSLAVTPPDCGDRIQVRSTAHLNGHLWVFEKDPTDHIYFLVITDLPVLNVVGYIGGVLAKRRELRPTPRGTLAHWVSQTELTPI